MKYCKGVIFLLLIALFCIKVDTVKSQNFYSLSEGWILSGSIGTTTFHGDVNDDKNRIWNNGPFSKYYYEHKKLMISGQMIKKFNHFIAIGGQGLYGGIGGSNDALDLYFSAKLLEFSMFGTIDFTNLLWGESMNRRMNIYGSGGIGLANFWTIKREISTDKIVQIKGYDDGKINLYDATTERVLHIEIGINYKINKRWDLNIAKSYRYLDTDKLDAHVEKKILMEQYGYFSLGLRYNFNIDFLSRIININFNGRYSHHSDPLVKKYERMQDNKRLKGDPFKRKGVNTRYKYKSPYKTKKKKYLFF
ncbi:hypothetical protein ACFLRZ_05815 [Bacteroidota bacterium]